MKRMLEPPSEREWLSRCATKCAAYGEGGLRLYSIANATMSAFPFRMSAASNMACTGPEARNDAIGRGSRLDVRQLVDTLNILAAGSSSGSAVRDQRKAHGAEVTRIAAPTF